MSHLAPKASSDTIQPTQQGLIESELSRAGLPQANDVAQRLESDMAHELAGLDTGQAYPSPDDTVEAHAQTREPSADQAFDAHVRSKQCRQAMRDARAVETLNQSLADCMDLQLQCQQAHWNTMSGDGPGLSSLFEEIGRAMGGHAQRLAERIAALGGVAGGTLVAISQRSGLNEYPLSQGPWQNDVTRVASALMIIRDALGDDTELLVQIDDADSADRLGALGRAAEHYLGNLSASRA